MKRTLIAVTMLFGLASAMSRADVEAVLAKVRKEAAAQTGKYIGVRTLFLGLQQSEGIALALEPFTEKDVLEVVRHFESERDWDESLELTMDTVFRTLGSKAVVAIDPLLKIARDETAPTIRRVRALHALESMSEFAERAVPDLQQLRKHRESDIREASTQAILATGSSEAAPILVGKLETAANWGERASALDAIAFLGPRGNAVGSSLLKYIDDENWEVRLSAVHALGCIGCTQAVGDLIRLLADEQDWRLVFDAADALGRLKAASAEVALAHVSETHWFPPVRTAAGAAIEAIHGKVVEPLFWGADLLLPPDYANLGEGLETIAAKEADSIRFPVVADPDQPLPIWTDVYMGGKVQWFGLKINGGYLAGYYGGEWGGKLAFVDAKRNLQILAEVNAELIYQAAGKFFAVTGYRHMGANQGLIYQLTEVSAGQWTAKPWRVLPGAAEFSRLLVDGRLFVSCSQGGIVLVSPDGKMQQLTRAEALK